jgi:muramoyltetrapeptide carboxypeptidase
MLLRANARIAAVSPAGPVGSTELTGGIKRLEAAGWSVDVIGPLNSSRSSDYLAATDRQRGQALVRALRTYDAVIFTRGGYGTTRLLESVAVQRQLSPRGPRPIVIGYSDATALLWAQAATDSNRRLDSSLLQPSGIHGPTLGTLATHDGGRSADRLISMLHGRPIEPLKVRRLTGPNTKVSGPLLPGNLTVATALLGTKWFPDLAGRIVVFEDVNEAPYRVDRMLTQWRQAGALRDVAAIVLGRFSCDTNLLTTDDMRAVFTDRLGDLSVPVFETTEVGHNGPCMALPIGVRATLRARTLTVD